MLYKDSEKRREYIINYRKNNREYYREHSKEYQRNLSTEVKRENHKKWINNNRNKYKMMVSAYSKVACALKKGLLQKKPCEICGENKIIHAHHEDYSKPLDVKWLCPLHHKNV